MRRVLMIIGTIFIFPAVRAEGNRNTSLEFRSNGQNSSEIGVHFKSGKILKMPFSILGAVEWGTQDILQKSASRLSKIDYYPLMLAISGSTECRSVCPIWEFGVIGAYIPNLKKWSEGTHVALGFEIFNDSKEISYLVKAGARNISERATQTVGEPPIGTGFFLELGVSQYF